MRLIGAVPARPMKFLSRRGEICLLLKAEQIGLRSTLFEEVSLKLSEPTAAFEPNYGRKRRILLKPEEQALESRREDREKMWEGLSSEYGQAGELLASGFHIISGATGNSGGRPPRGVRNEQQVAGYIEQLEPGFDYQSASLDDRAMLVLRLLEPPWSANAATLAQVWRVNRSTIWRLQKRGEALQRNSTTKGEAVSLT